MKGLTMPGKPVEPDERQKIIDLLHEHGGNRYRVAKIAKRSNDTIQRIATEEGIASVIRPANKNATEARKHYSAEDRQTLIEKALDVGAKMVERKGLKPRDFQAVMTGLAIGIDKHRLETGQATSRSDTQREHDERRQARYDRLYAALDTARGTEQDADRGRGDRGQPVDTDRA